MDFDRLGTWGKVVQYCIERWYVENISGTGRYNTRNSNLLLYNMPDFTIATIGQQHSSNKQLRVSHK